jgi:hypothetical protein
VVTPQEEVLAAFREMHDRVDKLPQMGWNAGVAWLTEQEPGLWDAVTRAEAAASVAGVAFFRSGGAWEDFTAAVGCAEVAWRRAADHLNGLADAGLL